MSNMNALYTPNKLRGKAENDIKELNLPTFSVFRPGFLSNRPKSSITEKII